MAAGSSTKLGQICVNINLQMSSHAAVSIRVSNALTHSLIQICRLAKQFKFAAINECGNDSGDGNGINGEVLECESNRSKGVGCGKRVSKLF
jgi:hypothetical protein